MSTAHNQKQTPFGTIGVWWRNWRQCRAAVREVDGLGGPELARVAQDVGLNVPQLRTLAGKWPDAAELLSQRLAALRLDERTIVETDPGVLRDLQRVCTMCPDQQRCGRDIEANPSDPEWRKYCPNAETLDAVELERAMRRLDHGRCT